MVTEVTLAKLAEVQRLDSEKLDAAGAVSVQTPYVLNGEILTEADLGEDGFFRGGYGPRGKMDSDGSATRFQTVVADGKVADLVAEDADGYLQEVQLPGGVPWRGAADVLVPKRSFPAPARWSAPLTDVTMIIVYGQSLSVGSGADELSGIRLIDPKRELMLNSGATSGELSSQEDATYFVSYTPAVDSEDRGEHSGQGIMDKMIQLADGSGPLLCVSCGRGGMTIASLSKGQSQYDQITHSVTEAKAIADAMGYTLKVGGVIYTQGEADESAEITAATYAAALRTLIADINTDVKAITSQTDDIHMVVDQLSVFADGSRVAQAQIDAARADPLIHISTSKPDAIIEYGDSVHASEGRDYYRLGEYQGEALAEVLATGSNEPLWIKRATVIDNHVLLDYPAKYGQLVLDSVNSSPVTAPYGFEAEDDSGSIDVLDVQVVGTSQVKLTLGAYPGAGLTIKYAYQSPGGTYASGRAAGGLRSLRRIYSRTDKRKVTDYHWAVTEAFDVDVDDKASLLAHLDPLFWMEAENYDGTDWTETVPGSLRGGVGGLADGPFDGLSRPALTATDATLNNLPVLNFSGSELASGAFNLGHDQALYLLIKPKSGTTGTVLECRDGSGNGFHLYVDDTAGKLKAQSQANTARNVADLDAWVLIEVMLWQRRGNDWLRIRTYGGSSADTSEASPLTVISGAVLTLGAPLPTSTGGQAGSADFDLHALVMADKQVSVDLATKIFSYFAEKANL